MAKRENGIYRLRLVIDGSDPVEVYGTRENMENARDQWSKWKEQGSSDAASIVTIDGYSNDATRTERSVTLDLSGVITMELQLIHA